MVNGASHRFDEDARVGRPNRTNCCRPSGKAKWADRWSMSATVDVSSLFLVFQLRLLLCFGQSNTGASIILSQKGFTSDAESPTLFTTSNNVLWGSSSEEIETRAAGEIISFKKQPKPFYDWTGRKYNSTIYFNAVSGNVELAVITNGISFSKKSCLCSKKYCK